MYVWILPLTASQSAAQGKGGKGREGTRETKGSVLREKRVGMNKGKGNEKASRGKRMETRVTLLQILLLLLLLNLRCC